MKSFLTVLCFLLVSINIYLPHVAFAEDTITYTLPSTIDKALLNNVQFLEAASSKDSTVLPTAIEKLNASITAQEKTANTAQERASIRAQYDTLYTLKGLQASPDALKKVTESAQSKASKTSTIENQLNNNNLKYDPEKNILSSNKDVDSSIVTAAKTLNQTQFEKQYSTANYSIAQSTTIITPEMLIEANTIKSLQGDAQTQAITKFNGKYTTASYNETATYLTGTNASIGTAIIENNQANNIITNTLSNVQREQQFIEAYDKQTNMQVQIGALPGFNGDIFAFFNKVIRASVSVAMTLAVFMLVLAGFAAVQAKDSAKEEYFKKVANVATGIFVILLSYLIITGIFALLYNI